jgi:hypothetical protein
MQKNCYLNQINTTGKSDRSKEQYLDWQCQFHKHFMSSFYNCRSPKYKKILTTSLNFTLLGSMRVKLKAARKHVGEIEKCFKLLKIMKSNNWSKRSIGAECLTMFCEPTKVELFQRQIPNKFPSFFLLEICLFSKESSQIRVRPLMSKSKNGYGSE